MGGARGAPRAARERRILKEAPAWRALTALFVAVAALQAGNGLLGTVLPLQMAARDFATERVGLVMAAYFAGLAVGSARVGRVVTRVGHIRAFACFAAGLAAVALGHALVSGAWAWLALRALAGLCMAGLYVCVESWLNGWSAPERRGVVLAAYMVAVYASQGGGQLLLVTRDPQAPDLLALVALLVVLAVIPVSLTRARPPELPTGDRLGVRQLAREAPLAVAGAATAGALAGAFYGLGPLYAHHLGLDAGHVARFMAASIVGGLVAQWPVGRLSDHLDRRRVLAAVAAAVVAASASAALMAPAPGGAAWVGAAAFGAFAFSLYPLSLAHGIDSLDAERALPASGSLLLTYAAGSAVGPLAGSFAMSALGAQGLFAFAGLLAGALGLYAAARIRRHEPVPEAEREPFRAVPRTTPVAAALDPRSPA